MQLATEGILESNKSARRSNLLFRRNIEQKKKQRILLEWNGVDNQSKNTRTSCWAAYLMSE
jgi:hypothetical protein